jgi:hypothetical protein
MIISAKDFYQKNYSSQFEALNRELEFDEIETRYFKGTKTLNWITNKNAGAIFRDFSIEKSFESFCTDESMRSENGKVNYDKIIKTEKVQPLK